MLSSMFGRMVVSSVSMPCLAKMIIRESFVFDPLSGVSSVRQYFRKACVVCPSRGILFVVERVHLQAIISEGVVPMLRGALCCQVFAHRFAQVMLAFFFSRGTWVVLASQEVRQNTIQCSVSSLVSHQQHDQRSDVELRGG